MVPDPEVEFTNYFICRKTRDALNTLGQDSLTQGVNLVHEGITYNVKMLATQTEEGNHSILIFRAYTKDALLIYTRWKLGFQKTPEAQISMETISDNLKTKGWGILMKESIGVVRANTESESAITLFPMIYDGAVIDGDVETPVFAGTLSAKATEVFKRHPELAPDQPPAYSRKQTAFAFLVSVLALTTVGYGIHKVRKGDITFPTRKEIADFLSKTKANASEYLSQLRQKKPQEGVKA